MPSKNRDIASVWDMVQAIQKICLFTHGSTFDEYLSDIRTISAVERQFEILGEAARRVSDSFQKTYPAIDWQRVIGLRNILALRY
ncbi:MAG: HepT-like ribonuclease domain-containing protein, partial [Elainellaceae cyanobacterium]